MSADHGYASYANGCRCEVCRAAARLYRREQRAARLASGQIEHGLTAGYDCGCRCPDCRDARSVRHQRYRARLRAGSAR